MMRFAADDIDHHAGWLFAVLAAGLAAMALAVFGTPPVSLHGPFHYFGIMDPLCGMTRATRFVARGDLSGAWRFNPGSFLLVGLALLVVARHAAGLWTGRWWRVYLERRLVEITCFVLLSALEVNQQLHASLLR